MSLQRLHELYSVVILEWVEVGTLPARTYAAVGGRLSILGAVYGPLLVNFAKTSLSESFPELWLFGLGGLFIAVVLAFPNGLAGIWRDHIQSRIDRLISSRKPKADGKNGWTGGSVADGAPAE